MQTTPKSESEARAASRRVLLTGWHEARIVQVHEARSKAGNDMTEILVAVADADGNERIFRAEGSLTLRWAGLKLRHTCATVGALAQYESGEISAAAFDGQSLCVKIGIEKKRGYPGRSVNEDYGASSVSVVNLRSAR
jgi:hypothetical protein